MKAADLAQRMQVLEAENARLLAQLQATVSFAHCVTALQDVDDHLAFGVSHRPDHYPG